MAIVALVAYLGAALVGLVFLLVSRKSNTSGAADGTSFLEVLAVGIPFSFLGVIVGYLTGISRDSAVGSVLPGVLTLLGALTLYLGANGGKKAILASATMIYLSIALVTGVGYGSRLRVKFDDFQSSPVQQLLQANTEASIKSYRQSIGLDEDTKSLAYLQHMADIEAQLKKYRKSIGLDQATP